MRTTIILMTTALMLSACSLPGLKHVNPGWANTLPGTDRDGSRER